MKKTKTLVLVSLLIAMEVVLTRFLSIQTPIIRIGFGFLPIAFCAILFGPAVGGVAAAASDVIGMLLFPKGTYFPGFTFSALLTGMIYGFYLYKKPINTLTVSKAVITVSIIVDIVLNTYWLTFLTGNAYMAMMLPRLLKTAVMIPVQIILIQVLYRYFKKIINSSGFTTI